MTRRKRRSSDEPVIEVIPDAAAEKQQTNTVVATAVSMSAMSGPLPPPEMLQGYEHVFPGCAKRIVAMAEKQQDHRQALEKTAIEANASNEKVGQWMAFALFVLVAGGGIWLVGIDRPVGGLSALLAALVTPVGLFAVKKRGQANELRRKREQAEQQAAS